MPYSASQPVSSGRRVSFSAATYSACDCRTMRITTYRRATPARAAADGPSRQDSAAPGYDLPTSGPDPSAMVPQVPSTLGPVPS